MLSRLQGRPPDASHSSSRALRAELAPVAAAVAPKDDKELEPQLGIELERAELLAELAPVAAAVAPREASDASSRVLTAEQASRQSAQRGFTRLITRAAC